MTMTIGSNACFTPPRIDGQGAQGRATVVDLIVLALFMWHASGVEQYIISQDGPAPLLFQVFSFGVLSLVVIGRILARAPVFGGRADSLFGFVVVLAIYAAWTYVNYLYGSMSEIAGEFLRSRLIAAVFMILFAYLLSGERIARALCVACAAVACLGAALDVYDLLVPTFSTTAGRAAGFYMNPNIAGFMIPCLGLFAMPGLSRTARHVVWAIVTVGAIVTFSRAAYIFLVVGTVGLSWLGYLGWRSHRFLFAAIVLPAVAVFLYALSSGALYDLVAASPFASHLNGNAIQRLGGGDVSYLENDSTTERRGVALLAVEQFLASPLIGHGFAFTQEWDFGQSTHNMYLLALAEGGVVGLVVYLTLIGYVSLQARNIGALVALIILLQGLFNHNILDDLQQALVLGALAGIGASARRVLPLSPIVA